MRHMRDPNSVLNSLADKDKGYEYRRLYRNLYNEDFYTIAYSRIYHKEGNMTAGSDGQTIDGMSLERIRELISKLKDHSYQPQPARRTYIPKRNGDLRPLGIPSMNDKLVQEVARSILEATYDKDFSDRSHGFRPNRSCHTALLEARTLFRGSRWWVEGDIKGFFDNIDHHVLVDILRRKIKDENFISLIWKFLKAGYLEDWQYHNTFSGTPQGGIISPILANIYLNELDSYMETYKENFDKGTQRKVNKDYLNAMQRQNRARKKYKAKWDSMSEQEKKDAICHLRSLYKEIKNMECTDHMDESFRRLQYVRYADDFLIGVIGSKEDATRIKTDLTDFLRDKLKLELSQEKTLITNAKDSARFLGYDIHIRHNPQGVKARDNGTKAKMFTNTVILKMPKEKWYKKLFDLKAVKLGGDNIALRPIHRGRLVRLDDLEILQTYNAEIRGFYNYYRLAENVSTLNDFRHLMYTSMLKTYANKYKTKTSQIIKKFSLDGRFAIQFSRKGKNEWRFFFDQSLSRDLTVSGTKVDELPNTNVYAGKTSLIDRLKAEKCEWCNKDNVPLEIHHVRKLKDLKKSKKAWKKLMVQRNRKTMALCQQCHIDLHAGKLD